MGGGGLASPPGMIMFCIMKALKYINLSIVAQGQKIAFI